MPGVKVLLKGMNKVIEFPSNVTMQEIEKAIKGNWDGVSEIKGLPMDSASRLDRARVMGFDVDKQYYHGTNAGFDEFDISKGGQNFGDSASKEGIFFQSTEEGADLYGDKIKSVYSKSKAKEVDAEDLLKREFEYLRNRGEFDGDFKEFIDQVTEGDPYGYYETGQLYQDIKDAKKEGFEGLEVNFGDITSRMAGRAQKFRVEFNPKNIRDVNAAFDPSKKDSSNLLAGVGGASAALGLGALGSEDASAQGRPINSLAPNITNPLLSMEQLAKLPSHLRPDVGSIRGPIKGDSDVVAAIQDLGGLLSKFEVPVLGNPVQGLADYMQNFGYNDSEKERLKRAAMAVLDFL